MASDAGGQGPTEKKPRRTVRRSADPSGPQQDDLAAVREVAARAEEATARAEAAAARTTSMLEGVAAAANAAAAALAQAEYMAEGAKAAATGGGGTGGGSSPTPTEAAPEDDPAPLRREVHALIGQVEGLLSLMRDHMEMWCAEDMRAGYEATHDRLGPGFGRMHERIDSGEYDENMREEGLADEHLEFKRRGLRGVIAAVRQAIVGEPSGEMPDRVGVAAQAGATVVGSVAEALQVATPIKEVIALVPTATELFKRQQR
jgi:hypothetical protein